jgi:UDP-MurNAc hydroxylase
LTVDVLFLGHAGLQISCGGRTILCDPWFNPAYLWSWFPYPDNSHLVRDDQLLNPDFLFVSHLHQDHFDRQFLSRVSKDSTVLLPKYEVGHLRRALEALGFSRFTELPFDSEIPLAPDLTVTAYPFVTPADGPLGDCALLVRYQGTSLLNLNDARPPRPEELRRKGSVDALFLQHSGAIWYPMVYDMPPERRQREIRRKQANQIARLMAYLDAIRPEHFFPVAGPPCFLDDDLFMYNAFSPEESIFYDPLQLQRIAPADALRWHHGTHAYHAPRGDGPIGHVIYPGTRVLLENGVVEVVPPDNEHVLSAYVEKKEYLDGYRMSWSDALGKFRESLPPSMSTEELLSAAAWMRDFLREARRLREGINGRVLMEGERGAFVLDFIEADLVPADSRACRYGFRFAPGVLEHALVSRCPDWVNEVFLSMRFTAWRVGGYNDYLYAFFKSLNEETLEAVERFFSSSPPVKELVKAGSYYVQRNCPHMGGDLLEFGELDDRGILTCRLHGWQYDLATGECLTSGDRLIYRTTTPGDREVAGELAPPRHPSGDRST